jgi:hypothetical protein
MTRFAHSIARVAERLHCKVSYDLLGGLSHHVQRHEAKYENWSDASVREREAAVVTRPGATGGLKTPARYPKEFI